MQKEEKCEICGKKATVHVTLLKNGQNYSINFCFEHAKEAGIFQAKNYALVKKEAQGQRLPQQCDCPHCGLTLKKFQETGRLGCRHCYDAFKAHLDRILPHVGQGSQHFGKTPSYLADAKVLKKRLKSLRDELQEAIKLENYEGAANKRDEIADVLTQLDNLKD